MYIFAEVEQEDDQRPGGQFPGQDQPRAVPEHQAGADGHDDLDDRREQHLDVARLQRGLDVLEALALEPLLLVVFARERLDHANRGEDLRDHRHQLAFLLPDVARGALDAPREGVHHQEEHRRDRQRDQREAPVQIEHHGDDADQRQQRWSRCRAAPT